MYIYDVAFSFAGEDRKYVKKIAKKLESEGLKVFYDDFEQAKLWGKDLYQYLNYIYKESALFCVVFASSAYLKKAWTRHELKAAQSRAFHENREYILPIFLTPDVQLPGENDTMGRIDTEKYTSTKIVNLIIEKVKSVGALKEEDFQKKVSIYKLAFETYNFIILKFTSFGEGSRINEICLILFLIECYKDFLLDYSYEINAELYVFLIKILRELEKNLENKSSNLVSNVNLQFKTEILNILWKEYEKSGFNAQFDFHYYLYQHDSQVNKDEMLLNILSNIADEIIKTENLDSKEIVQDYLEHIARVKFYEEYTHEDDLDAIMEKMLEIDEIKIIIDDFNSSNKVGQ